MNAHRRDELTGEAIGQNARVALFRAINLRRLIAMTGSGATNAFGLPDWSDLTVLFAQATQEQVNHALPDDESGKRGKRRSLNLLHNARKKEIKQLIHPLVQQINSLCGAKPAKGSELPKIDVSREKARSLNDPLIVMDLCEEVLRLLPDDEDEGKSRLHLARQIFAQHFRESETDLISRRLQNLFARLDAKSSAPKKSKKLSRISWQDLPEWFQEFEQKEQMFDPNRETTGAYVKILALLVSGWRNDYSNVTTRLIESIGKVISCTPAEYSTYRAKDALSDQNYIGVSNGFGPTLPDQPPRRDIVRAILSDLNLSRIATLNYDVQVERAVLSDLKEDKSEDAVAFGDLCKEYSTPRPHQKRLVIESGIKKGAVSITLAPGNIGEIVNFAGYPRRFERQILHLHGRFDDPDNMVVTYPDYQRVYMQESIPREIFREAQEVLFGGNDVLLLGIGMQEEDVLRPFRRFVSRNDDSPQGSRRIFLLRATNYDSNARQKDQSFAIRLYISYNINTIFFGGPRFREVQSILNSPRDAISTVLSKTHPSDDTKATTAIIELVDTLDKLEASALEGETRTTFLLSPGEIELLRKVPSDGKLSDRALQALDALLYELSGRVVSRGLCHELRALRTGSGHWWDDWNRLPMERQALHHMASARISGAEHYLWVRHCPAYAIVSEKEWAFEDWTPLRAARAEVLKVMSNPESAHSYQAEIPKRRVLRLTSNRGGGKGSVVRLLMRRQYQRQLFANFDNEEQNYLSSFVAHLSYSIEFSSIVLALTRFVARNTAKLQVIRSKTPDAAPELIRTRDGIQEIEEELKKILQKPRLTKSDIRRNRLRFAELLRNLAPAEKDDCHKDLELLKDIMFNTDSAEKSLEPAQITTLAEAIFVSRREQEPRLVIRPELRSADCLDDLVERPHRLDVLRDTLQSFADLAVLPDDRLFVCLGGLDRICNQDGDGRNPMHRALFRLLTGALEGQAKHPDPPIDLVLVAGRPDAPISFLSEEVEDPSTIRTELEKHYSRRSKTGRVLKHWPTLPKFSWEERSRLLLDESSFRTGTSVRIDHSGSQDDRIETRRGTETELREERLRIFVNWAKQADRGSRRARITESQATRKIHRALWENVSVCMLVMAAWAESTYSPNEEDKEFSHAVPDVFVDFTQELEQAVARDGLRGVINHVLSTYYRADRRKGLAIDNESSAYDLYRAWADTPDAELTDLILRHLALFSLPVEPLVLLDCPLIFRRLGRLYSGLDGELERRDQQRLKEPPQRSRSKTWLEWQERTWMLRKLRTQLDNLTRRNLVIQILASHDPIGSNVLDGNPLDPAFLHRRYALHAGLRQHLAYKMQLHVAEDGDLNQSQVSIYCDQPKDLPTPSPQHFAMLSDLLEAQIGHCLETLHVVTSQSSVGRLPKRELWDPEEEDHNDHASVSLAQMAAFHLYGPTKSPQGDASDTVDAIFAADGLAGGLGRLHAVSQCLRACFSLLRGAFSVGALSRLDGLSENNSNMPFEIYHGWLREMLSVATGLERCTPELNWVLEGSFYPVDPHDFWKENVKDIRWFQNISPRTREQLTREIATRPISQTENDDSKAGRLLRFWTRLGFSWQEVSDRVPGHHLPRDLWIAAERMLKTLQAANTLSLGTRQETTHRTIRHPFYRDEIAWLYNERGLTLMIQGRVLDALPIFRQARFIMSHKRTPTSDTKAYHAAERRISLNLAVAEIYRGNLVDARDRLEDLTYSSRHIKGSTPSKVLYYAQGYIALCDHLGGSLERAITGYRSVLKRFVRERQLRAVSIFNRHLGDLYLLRGELDLAEQKIQLAINAASQAEQRDVQNLAQTSQVALLIERREFEQAGGIIRVIDGYARQLGLYRLRTDILIVEARLRLARGESGAAADVASQAISLAVRHGMRLRKLAALVLYGSIQISRGEMEFARSILEDAKRECEQRGYQIQAARASDLLVSVAPYRQAP